MTPSFSGPVGGGFRGPSLGGPLRNPNQETPHTQPSTQGKWKARDTKDHVTIELARGGRARCGVQNCWAFLATYPPSAVSVLPPDRLQDSQPSREEVINVRDIGAFPLLTWVQEVLSTGHPLSPQRGGRMGSWYLRLDPVVGLWPCCCPTVPFQVPFGRWALAKSCTC